MHPISTLLMAPAFALLLGLAVPALADTPTPIQTDLTTASVPDKKHTKSGLYLTAAQASDLLSKRDDVLLIDVRSPEETMFVGYPTAADANIPFKLVDPAHSLNAKKGAYTMVENPNFLPATKAFLAGKSPAAILVMCRSGGRSAKAINAMIAAGIDTPIYNVIDGFEGDKSDAGRRDLNGWKQAGAYWTYKIRADLLITSQ